MPMMLYTSDMINMTRAPSLPPQPKHRPPPLISRHSLPGIGTHPSPSYPPYTPRTPTSGLSSPSTPRAAYGTPTSTPTPTPTRHTSFPFSRSPQPAPRTPNKTVSYPQGQNGYPHSPSYIANNGNNGNGNYAYSSSAYSSSASSSPSLSGRYPNPSYPQTSTHHPPKVVAPPGYPPLPSTTSIPSPLSFKVTLPRMSYYLAIVSPRDAPLFELAFPSTKSPPGHTSFPSWSSFTTANGGDAGPLGGGGAQSSTSGAQGTGSQPQSQGSGANATANQNRGAAPLPGDRTPAPGQGVMDKYLLQMIAHAALDAVEDAAEGTGSLYLKAVDKHNEWTVSAFIATNVKFILLHDTKNDDGIRLFFADVWEAYIKTVLNPFHTVNTTIRNPAFEAKVRDASKRYL